MGQTVEQPKSKSTQLNPAGLEEMPHPVYLGPYVCGHEGASSRDQVHDVEAVVTRTGTKTD